MFGGIARFEGTEGRFRSWVFAIAHNLVIDDRRRRSRRPLQAALEGDVGPSAPGAEDAALVADHSIEDTAAALGKKPGAVKSLQHRALASLRKRLGEDGAVSP